MSQFWRWPCAASRAYALLPFGLKPEASRVLLGAARSIVSLSAVLAVWRRPLRAASRGLLLVPEHSHPAVSVRVPTR